MYESGFLFCFFGGFADFLFQNLSNLNVASLVGAVREPHVSTKKN